MAKVFVVMNGIDFQFQPHRWFRGGHAQTVAALYYPSTSAPYGAVEHTVELDDGDRLVVHDDCPESWSEGQRVVISVHGLAGCHRSGSVSRLADKLVAKGVRCFRMDQRGCGAGAAIAKHHAHAGRSDDVGAILDFVLNECPDSPVTIVGFSMGGNLALKLAGEMGATYPKRWDQLITIAPPIDLERCSRNIQRGLKRIYDRAFIRKMRRSIYDRRAQVAELSDIELRQLPGRLFEFDDTFTAPLAGFESASDYYYRCSSARALDQIQVPTVIITSKDDPLVPFASFEVHPRSESVQLIATDHGGHLGFISSSREDPDRWWVDWRILELVAAMPERFSENAAIPFCSEAASP